MYVCMYVCMMRVIVKVAHPNKQTVGGFVPVSLGLARVQEVSELSMRRGF